MSIEIEKINKSYDNQQVLHDISFSMKKGEIVGFLGPNGAGKSTLMRIITCFIDQDNGVVKVCDIDNQKDEILAKSKIGYLPENNPLYSEMYIKQYLNFVANIYNIKDYKNRVEEMINITGLSPESNKKIKQLSKGYKQRVGLAAALIHDPEVLILDEPTTGLDPNQLLEIRNLIKETGKNKTVLLSTHIMQEVEKICTRVILIHKGKIIEDKSIEELKREKINLEEYFQQLTN